MRPLNVRTPSGHYPIFFVTPADTSWPALADWLQARFTSGKIAIATSPTVGDLYYAPLASALQEKGLTVYRITLDDGEANKTLATLSHIYDQLIDARLGRNDPLIALGGGVVGDMVGFAAATYLRGVPYIQIPTTLLAQVDSSVGGKTGVDHPLGKNLIGAFYQPDLVWIDLSTLTTLPPRQVRAGFAEIIKYGAIADRELAKTLRAIPKETLEAPAFLTSPELADIIRRSCHIKAQIVGADEREINGKRALLNFGHTVGHAIEAATAYDTYLHGEAVAIGMVYAAHVSHALGYLSTRDVSELTDLIAHFGLKTTLDAALNTETLLDYMTRDKKMAKGKLNFVVLNQIGKARLHPLSIDELSQILKTVSL